VYEACGNREKLSNGVYPATVYRSYTALRLVKHHVSGLVLSVGSASIHNVSESGRATIKTPG
jgi:hypothetical protein